MQHRHLAASLCLLGAAAAGCGTSQAAPAASHLNAILGRPAGTSGGSPPADASLTGVHACKLIDATVIRSVIGPLFRAPYEVPDGLECFYEPAVPGGAGPDVIVTVMPRSGFEAAEAFDQGAARRARSPSQRCPAWATAATRPPSPMARSTTRSVLHGAAGRSASP